MPSISVKALAFFAASVYAGNLNILVPRELRVRQDQSFTPTTTSGEGATCADAFGAGYIDCNGTCYNPTIGETCCSGNGDAYPCPSESFCLINGLCCPDGLSPESCATQNGVTLPADFGVSATTSPPTPETPVPTVSVVAPTASTSSVFEPTASVVVATPYPIPGNETAPIPTGTATGGTPPTGTGAGPAASPFVGGAGSLHVASAGLFGAVLGAAGLML